MSPLVRSILGVIAGLVAAIVVISIVEMINIMIFPLPPGVDVNDPASLGKFIAEAPAYKLVGVVVGYALGAFVGAWLAVRIALRLPAPHALVIGAVLLAATIANLMMIPHPLWFAVASLGVILPAALVGGRAVRTA